MEVRFFIADSLNEERKEKDKAEMNIKVNSIVREACAKTNFRL
jgi:hypothetical protein